MADTQELAASILVLDTDLRVLPQLKNELAQDGHKVDSVSSIDRFHVSLEQGQYDLVLIDRMNSQNEGLELARDVRRKSDAGVIVTSCSDDGIDRIIALELGADDAVTKPFDPRELRARVRAVLRRTLGAGREKGLAPTTGPLRFHGYLLDTERRSVLTEENREIRLTDAEFDALRALAERPNRVLSRQEILTAIHGNARAMGGRPVDVLVSRLRAKLYPDENAPGRIKTVRGVGYMLAL